MQEPVTAWKTRKREHPSQREGKTGRQAACAVTTTVTHVPGLAVPLQVCSMVRARPGGEQALGPSLAGGAPASQIVWCELNLLPTPSGPASLHVAIAASGRWG